MTKKRYDAHSTEFGLWLRDQDEIASARGFVATNVDYLWRNYRTRQFMLLEEKRYGASVKFPQTECFAVLDRACQSADGYEGFHVIRFENTSPDDGRMWLDDAEIDRAALIRFLRFEVAD